jgi:asparagine synthase (glutamine-hydrolysing)
MCGVGGYLLHSAVGDTASLLTPILAGLRHRGPDDEGIALIDRTTREVSVHRTSRTVASLHTHLTPAPASKPHDLALINTRYAIVDLSDRAHQPFVSGDGSIVATFNGEIYNFHELRTALTAAGAVLRTASDTEALVEGYGVWGDDLWRRLNGFWAVVLYDARRRTVIVSRDRMGVAPLYYRETPGGLFFASEIRPLLDVAPGAGDIDQDTVTGFIEHGLKDFDAATCYRDVRSFPAACVLRFAGQCSRVAQAERTEYWRYPSRRWSARDLSLDEAAVRVRHTLTRAVELRLRADVPVAFELSGGLDSSSIVAVAATLRDSPVSTYTISVPGRDEEPYARQLRERYRLDYHVLRGDERQFDADGGRFDAVMEEPYHSPNSFTAWQMRRAMKAQGVSVVVSGSGGDECLAGYEYEFWPAAARGLRAEGQLGHTLRHSLAMRFGSVSRARLAVAEAIGGLKRTVGVRRPEAIREPTTRAGQHARRYGGLSFHEQTLYHFTVAQLPYYLRNNDHLTMSIPLEARFPFLDIDMVELGLQLPAEYLYRDGWTKYALRRALEPLLPARITWRRDKMGFPFPLETFLADRRGAFERDWQRVTDVGLVADAPARWPDRIATDPVRLWRIISTGRWLGAR